ncbi:hypothetical protein ElyMa_002149500 [Elysia marginata]|uniref:Uncharacterized protein n=1 Tax=Elysia marginata TaxID=1093978 RepID=A0AAV4FNS5_9GAST|nr:hypothetical protein ElyMa_002149500 [Elysia marginata]
MDRLTDWSLLGWTGIVLWSGIFSISARDIVDKWTVGSYLTSPLYRCTGSNSRSPVESGPQSVCLSVCLTVSTKCVARLS